MSRGARNWPFLIFTGLPGAGHRVNEIGLATQERGRLQHVDHRCHFRDLLGIVHIGQHRHADLAFTSARIASPSSMPGPRNDFPELRLALSYDDL